MGLDEATTVQVQTKLIERRLSPSIGSEIHGVDLRNDLLEETIAEIRQILLERKVVFFRDQDITRAQHIAFARRFGELEIPTRSRSGTTSGVSTTPRRTTFRRSARWSGLRSPATDRSSTRWSESSRRPLGSGALYSPDARWYAYS